MEREGERETLDPRGARWSGKEGDTLDPRGAR